MTEYVGGCGRYLKVLIVHVHVGLVKSSMVESKIWWLHRVCVDECYEVL